MPCGYVDSANEFDVKALAIGSLHILREASALLVQQRWAIPEPPFVERAMVRLSRFVVNKIFFSW